MLMLSVMTMIATGGLSYVLAMARMVWDATRRAKPIPDGTPILVLGVRLAVDGDIAREFQERLDHGVRLLLGMTHGEIVVLGGVTRPNTPSEADTGKEYLIWRCDVAADRIQCERRSRHTLENLHFHRYGPAYDGRAVSIVTSRFHMARASLLARGLGMTVLAAPSDRGLRSAFRVLVRLPWEGLLIHWYVTGRAFARVTGNTNMIKRIV